MSKYMDYVNQLAIQNVENGGDPFAACIVYEDEIIAEGVNELHLINDITRHAELIAIQKAQKHLDSKDLSKCTLYASGHPCPMCMGAIGFSNLKEVYYHNSLEDAENVNLGLSKDIYHYIQNKPNPLEIKMIRVVDEDNDPMKVYAKRTAGY